MTFCSLTLCFISDHHCKHHYPSKSYGAFVFRNHSKNDEQVHSIFVLMFDVYEIRFRIYVQIRFYFFLLKSKNFDAATKEFNFIGFTQQKKVNSPFFSTFNILKTSVFKMLKIEKNLVLKVVINEYINCMY